MQFLDKLLHKRPASELYSEVIATTKVRLSSYRATAPLAYDAILCNRELLESIAKIPEREAEYYWKARFLGGVLSAVWAIQRKADLERDLLRAERLASGTDPVLDSGSVLARVLTMKDGQLQEEVLVEGVGLAAIAVRHDADVDLKVARDLGRAEGYPERPPLPAAENESEMFRVTGLRVRLFWQTVLPVPVYPLLYFVTEPSATAAVKALAGSPTPRAPVEHETDAKPRQSDRDMVAVLNNLCSAYAKNDLSLIASLEPKATRIGEALNRRGGIEEMRRVFNLVRPQQGRRTLEMHWGGIGEWRG